MINIDLNQKNPKICKKRRSLSCRVQNKGIKGVALQNKIGQQKSACVDCDSKRPTFLKRMKTKNTFYKLQNMHIYYKNCKKHTKYIHPKKLVLILDKKAKPK